MLSALPPWHLYCDARSPILASLVTLRTWTFAISFIKASATLAEGLICPDAQYIAVRWNDGRLDRRHLPEAVWQMLRQELAQPLAPGPVGRSSTISAVLVGSMGAVMTVAFREIQQLEASGPEDAQRVLDEAARQDQPA